MDGSKHPLKSLGLVAPVVAFVVFLANRIWPGMGVADADVAPIIEQVDVVLGLLLAAWGRWRATKRLSTGAAVAFLLASGLVLSACAGMPWTAPADPAAPPKTTAERTFEHACAGLSVAHGSFVAVAPALLASGRLTAEQIAAEQATFVSLEMLCTNPPASVAELVPRLAGHAAAIYLMMAGNAPASGSG